MIPCIFCEEKCMSEESDEGLLGYGIGNSMICSGCITRLKELLIQEGLLER